MPILMEKPLTMITISDVLVFCLLLTEFGHILAEKLSSNASFECISPTFVIREEEEVMPWLKEVWSRNESECGFVDFVYFCCIVRLAIFLLQIQVGIWNFLIFFKG